MSMKTVLYVTIPPSGRPVIAIAATVSALALVACGDDSQESSSEAEATATPQMAIEEIGATRSGLAAAGVAYAKGDAEEADQLAGDAYLEHFEIVEGPLEEVDPELTESLEELIREELRSAITSGEPAADVQALVDEADSGLTEAETALTGSAGE